MKVKVYHNGDDVFIAWSFRSAANDTRLAECDEFGWLARSREKTNRNSRKILCAPFHSVAQRC